MFAPWSNTGLHLFEISNGCGDSTPAITSAGVIVAADRGCCDPALDVNAVNIAIAPVATDVALATSISYRAIPSMLTYRDRTVTQNRAVHYIHTARV